MEQFEFVNQLAVEVPYMEEMKQVLNHAIQKLNCNPCSFSVIFVGAEEINQLNREYRGIDRVTDVITFALEDDTSMPSLEIRLLGDIYICVPKAEAQADEYGHSIKRELCFLVVHGFLHLLGYDHMVEEEEKEMFALQEEILNEVGITR